MKPLQHLILMLATILLSVGNAFAWGPDGHRIVGQIAYDRLSPEARAQVDALLKADAKYDSLADASNWADHIKSDKKWDSAKPLHYVNMSGEQYDADKDCKDGKCVVAAIEKYTEILKDKTATPEAKLEALKFVAHFVGDIHQPLHAGHAKDKGGNDIKVEFFHDRTNLHRLWDSGIIRRTKKNWTELTSDLKKTITDNMVAECRKSATPAAWAEESRALAVTVAYPIPKDGVLAEDYYKQALPVVEKRLTEGGIRLADLLNEVFAGQPLAPEAAKDATSGDTAKPVETKPAKAVPVS